MLLDELVSWKRRIEGAGDDQFLSVWKETLSWLASADRQESSELLASSQGDKLRGLLAPFQRRYLTLQENEVAERLFSFVRQGDGSLAQLLDMPFARQTYERVTEALDLVDFSRCRLFVNIGCGPFPAAALLIHERTTVPAIVAVDNDAVAVDLASQVVRRLASPRLAIRQGEGSRYDFNGADVIYVANHVFPKADVLRHIAETAPLDTKVLVREPCGLGLLLAEEGCASLPAPLRILRVGADDANFYSKHVLCIVGANSADRTEWQI